MQFSATSMASTVRGEDDNSHDKQICEDDDSSILVMAKGKILMHCTGDQVGPCVFDGRGGLHPVRGEISTEYDVKSDNNIYDENIKNCKKKYPRVVSIA